MEDFWNSIEKDSVPTCHQCQGTIRPNVVFFGEGIPSTFLDNKANDLKNSDLVIVMGTSLVVYPFAGLVNEVKESIPRLLINRDPVGPFRPYSEDENARKFNYRDVSLLGDCDQGVLELIKLLGWEDDFQKLISS
jgi:NAD-dependent SIR2 family protein deacetylase